MDKLKTFSLFLQIIQYYVKNIDSNQTVPCISG